MARTFIIDFRGEEDDPSADELTRADLTRTPRGKKSGHKVAFTVEDMRELAHGRLVRGHPTHVRRGRNDELALRVENIDVGRRGYQLFVEYRLFGNLIASFFPASNTLMLYDAGWRTKTTLDRLNTLLINENILFYIIQRNYEWWIMPVGDWDVRRWERWEGQKEFKLA